MSVPIIEPRKEKHGMDWKEAGKWIGVIVVAGVISAGIEIALERWLTNKTQVAAKAEARAEVEKIMSSAMAQMQRGANANPKLGETPRLIETAPRQSDQRGYSYQF
jgi:hypothetical protein